MQQTDGDMLHPMEIKPKGEEWQVEPEAGQEGIHHPLPPRPGQASQTLSFHGTSLFRALGPSSKTVYRKFIFLTLHV